MGYLLFATANPSIGGSVVEGGVRDQKVEVGGNQVREGEGAFTNTRGARRGGQAVCSPD